MPLVHHSADDHRVHRPVAGIKDTEDELAAGMTPADSLQRNKRNVQAFYDLMFNQARPGDFGGLHQHRL
jgi:hypothetical protein